MELSREFHLEQNKRTSIKMALTHVTLDNRPANAKIDYATGNAEPLFAKVETTVIRQESC